MPWLIVAAVLLVLLLAAARFTYHIAFYVPKRRLEDIYELPKGKQFKVFAGQMHAAIREIEALPFEQVYITSFDGTRLAGRYYHVQDGAPIQIQFHGYRSYALRDFCGGALLAMESGQNVLLIDQRAHGKSGGSAITFGVKERKDCLCWINYINQRFGSGTKILLTGISMGAATVLMASQLELPENVAGIIADSPYSAPGAIIRKVCADVKLPAKVVYPFIWLGALIYGHFRLDQATAVSAVHETKIPILLIHGEADRFVPCEMSREIFESCTAPKMLHTFPEAGHGLNFFVDGPRYRKVLAEFMELCGI